MANRNYILVFVGRNLYRLLLCMTNSQLTITTPIPWSDGYDEGEFTITPRTSSGFSGDDLLATLQSPGTLQSEDTHGDLEVTMSVYSVRAAHQPADQAVRVLQVPKPEISNLVYHAVPEANATHIALIGAVFLSLAWRRFRRR